MPGPIPKRSTQVHGNHRSKRDKNLDIVEPITDEPEVTNLTAINPKWHKAMRTWFKSLRESGQSRFYQPSDWSTARMWCDIMTQEFRHSDGIKASMVAQFNMVANSLLTTEGARRRVRMEILPAEAEKEIKDTMNEFDHVIDQTLGDV